MIRTKKWREKRFPVGKRIGKIAWVHRDYVDMLEPEDRAYIREGEEALRKRHPDYEWTIVKFDVNYRGLSFLAYPYFDEQAHPELLSYVPIRDDVYSALEAKGVVKGGGQILHRKELMVGEDHPNYDKLVQLTKDEEEAGLLGRDVTSRIGYKNYWEKLLEERGFKIVRGVLVHVSEIR